MIKLMRTRLGRCFPSRGRREAPSGFCKSLKIINYHFTTPSPPPLYRTWDLWWALGIMIHIMLSLDEPLLIVSRLATQLRMIRGFLLRAPREECPAYKIPLHTVMKITWDSWREPVEVKLAWSKASGG